MTKHFIALPQGRIFYRQFGAEGGPPLVLLHPSPLSSALFERLGTYLSDSFTVYAPDLPGYGLSDPLPTAPDSLADYLPFLHQLLDHLELPSVQLYGTATGCQLAIAFALAYPERVTHLVGENACHFEDAERAVLFETYFPDLRPRADGSHLADVWRMCYKTCIGFPWTAVPDTATLPDNFPLAVVQGMVRDTLLAGENYHWAYRAAFEHERAELVQALLVPATFVIWSGSIVLPYMERLAAFSMPANVQFLRCDGDLTERYALVKEALQS